MLKIRVLRGAVLPGLLIACGCSSMSPTDNGVLGGGAGGAVLGGVVGHALGSTAAGAAIGAVTGAAAGGIIGNQVEKKEIRQAAAAEHHQEQVGIAEVIQMAQSHVNDSVIITKIRTSGTVFHLSAQDVLTLKQNGVSDVVVNEMMATATRYPRRVYSAAPAYEPGYSSTVYVVEPAPPPVAVGVGFYGGRRGWR